MRRLRTLITIGAAYLSIVGLVTFSCFILEEAIQMSTFGTWPAKSAQDWPTVLRGADVIQHINRQLRFINHWFGWAQPLALVSYNSFSDATDYYVHTLHSVILAHQPELMVGREIDVNFKPKQVERVQTGFILHNGAMQVAVSDLRAEAPSAFEPVRVRGTLRAGPGGTFIIETQ